MKKKEAHTVAQIDRLWNVICTKCDLDAAELRPEAQVAMELVIGVVSAVGVFTLLYAAVILVCTLYQYAIYNFSYDAYKGDWAVVTGASGDIGGALVLALAKRGVNVLLLARSVDKMTDVAKEAQHKYKVQTQVHAFDFAQADEEQWQALQQVACAKSPSILINNVGISLEMPTDLVDVEDALIQRMVKVNIESTNRMTKMLLPAMRQQKKGIIVCLASGGGAVTPAPMLTPYAGTKAYNDAFAVSLSGEVRRDGVHVHSLTPFFVAGSMAKMRPSLSVPAPTTFAESALCQIASSPRLNPHWVHHVMAAAVRALPLREQTRRVDALHRAIRARALRKKHRAAKRQ
ncbi:unnamed protein product [Agarophyton chilense]|eukprot:gb/GEZJ01001176.1/.p1 GENE.gb/GEZJ01001176.1/~~gb/GEZJ01001176.1/.p1  ORF type:complete len:346 (-),score=52.83 gb/GEZJ01001176.1/:372-1409(-)